MQRHTSQAVLKKQGRALRARVIRAGHSVPNRLCRFKDLVIVASLVRFVPKEVDFIEILFHELQAVSFVPANGEDIKADLAADAVREVEGGEALLEHLHELLPAEK